MRKAVVALFVLYALLAGVVVWLVTERNTQPEEITVDESAIVDDPIVIDSMITALPEDARIAYFFMDSVEQNFEMVVDREESFRQEGIRLEKRIKAEAKRAQRRYEELMGKDRTYSTQADLVADETELQNLMEKMQNMQAESENELAKLEINMLQEITESITDYLSVYNEKQNLDFIYSIQPGGQIWVGNEGLDITSDVIRGLNSEYQKSRGS